MVGLLAPLLREKSVGRAEVRQVFSIPKVGSVAGCIVTEGKVLRSGQVRPPSVERRMIMLPAFALVPIRWKAPRCRKSVDHFWSDNAATWRQVVPRSRDA